MIFVESETSCCLHLAHIEASIHIFPTMEFKHSAHLRIVNLYQVFMLIKCQKQCYCIFQDAGCLLCTSACNGIMPTNEGSLRTAWIYAIIIKDHHNPLYGLYHWSIILLASAVGEGIACQSFSYLLEIFHAESTTFILSDNLH